MTHQQFAELIDHHVRYVLAMLIVAGVLCAWQAFRALAQHKPGSTVYAASGVVALAATTVALATDHGWPLDLAAIAGGFVMTGVYLLGFLLGFR